MRVKALGVKRDRLAQGVGSLALQAKVQQRDSHSAVRRGRVELARKEAGAAAPCLAAPSGPREHCNNAPLNSGPVRLDCVPAPPLREPHVAKPHVRRRVVGIHVDRRQVLLGGRPVVAVHGERRTAPRVRRDILRVYVHGVHVALHGPPPAGAGQDGERMPQAGAHRGVVGGHPVGPLVPLDGCLEPADQYEQVAHSQEGKHVAGARPGGLSVGLLRLGEPAEAQQGMAPAHEHPRAAFAVLRPAQAPVARRKGSLGGLARLVRAAVRVHHGRPDQQADGHVPRPALDDALYERRDGAQVLGVVEPQDAERVDQVVPQCERAVQRAAPAEMPIRQAAEPEPAQQPPDRADVLEPAPGRLDPGYADQHLFLLALDVGLLVARAAPLVEALL